MVGGAPGAPSKMTCLTAGCNSTRIRKGCGRRMCKAHCHEAGSIGICTDPAHKVSQPTMTAAVAPPTSSFPVNAGPLLLPLSMQQKPVEPNHFESQRQLPVPPIASSSHRTGPCLEKEQLLSKNRWFGLWPLMLKVRLTNSFEEIDLTKCQTRSRLKRPTAHVAIASAP